MDYAAPKPLPSGSIPVTGQDLLPAASALALAALACLAAIIATRGLARRVAGLAHGRAGRLDRRRGGPAGAGRDGDRGRVRAGVRRRAGRLAARRELRDQRKLAGQRRPAGDRRGQPGRAGQRSVAAGGGGRRARGGRGGPARGLARTALGGDVSQIRPVGPAGGHAQALRPAAYPRRPWRAREAAVRPAAETTPAAGSGRAAASGPSRRHRPQAAVPAVTSEPPACGRSSRCRRSRCLGPGAARSRCGGRSRSAAGLVRRPVPVRRPALRSGSRPHGARLARPAGPAQPRRPGAARGAAHPDGDAAALWEALDRGVDLTDTPSRRGAGRCASPRRGAAVAGTGGRTRATQVERR